MEYLQTLCFSGFNSKKEKLPVRKKKKRATRVVSVAIEFCMSRQTSKKMERELCHEKRQRVAT